MSTAAQAPRPNVQAVSVAVSTQATTPQTKLPPTTPAESTAAQVSMSNALRTPQTTTVAETAVAPHAQLVPKPLEGPLRTESKPVDARLSACGQPGRNWNLQNKPAPRFRTRTNIRTCCFRHQGTASELSKGQVRARASSKSTSSESMPGFCLMYSW